MKEKIKYSNRIISVESALDVERNYAGAFAELFNYASQLFIFKGFPEEVDIDYAVENLLLTGNISFFKSNSKYYLLDAFLGGKQNVVYRPTLIQVSNNILGHLEFTNEKDAVMLFLTPFDRAVTQCPGFDGGLYHLISRTAILLADNITSINCAQMNSRVAAICGVETQNDASGVEETLKEIYMGKPYKVVKSSLLSSFQVNPLSNSTSSKTITELVELHQYILASFFNTLGVQFNGNMKRERLISDEVNANSDALTISIDVILNSLKKGCESINRIFGLNTSIELNPIFERLENPNEEEEPDDKGDDKNDDVSDEEKNDVDSVD